MNVTCTWISRTTLSTKKKKKKTNKKKTRFCENYDQGELN